MSNEREEDLTNRKKEKGKLWRGIAITVGFVVTVIVSVYVGNILTVNGVLPITSDSTIQKSLQGLNNVEEFSKLFQIRETLYKYYDGEIDDSVLAEGAIKGMVSSLKDPYTYFMNADEAADFKEKSEGSYMGVGIQVAVKDNKITVVAPIDGSPAQKAGILSGDVILKVNDLEVTGEQLDKAVSMMKGKTKEDIKLTLYRESKGEFEVTVTRDVIKMVSVKGELLADNIGYIQVTAFDEGTAKDFNAKLKELEGQGMKGLILDLRDNPGGFMNECVDLVSNFVAKDKVIVSTIDKYKNEEQKLSSGGIAQGMPLVVLINGGTASAAEIVSGAIKDYDLGTLIGTTSFGKGVVQVVLDDKNDGTALKVTISKYYTPNGENIHKIGIKPHIEVEYPKELLEKQYNRGEDPQFNKALEVIKEKVK